MNVSVNIRLLEVKFWLYHTLVVCPWANHSMSMSPIFSIYKNLITDGTYPLGLA